MVEEVRVKVGDSGRVRVKVGDGIRVRVKVEGWWYVKHRSVYGKEIVQQSAFHGQPSSPNSIHTCADRADSYLSRHI
jgi:hypothetical protein